MLGTKASVHWIEVPPWLEVGLGFVNKTNQQVKHFSFILPQNLLRSLYFKQLDKCITVQLLWKRLHQDKVDKSDYRKITIHSEKVIIFFKQLPWNEINNMDCNQPKLHYLQMPPTFWTCWNKPMFPERTIRVNDRDNNRKTSVTFLTWGCDFIAKHSNGSKEIVMTK